MSVAPPLSALEALPPAVRRRVRTLGHALTRLRDGLQLLQQQTTRGTVAAAFPAEWFQRWTGDSLVKPLPLPVDSPAGLCLTWQDHAWQVASPLASEAGSANMSAEWLVALLLLQLPALKSFWQRALRTQRFALLRRVLPRVWPLDLSPLPHGATISGLGLARWQDLPRLLAKGRRFQLVNLEGEERFALDTALPPAVWQSYLDQAAQGRWVVIEHESTPGAEGSAWATWETKDGWIDLSGLKSQPAVAA